MRFLGVFLFLFLFLAVGALASPPSVIVSVSVDFPPSPNGQRLSKRVPVVASDDSMELNQAAAAGAYKGPCSILTPDQVAHLSFSDQTACSQGSLPDHFKPGAQLPTSVLSGLCGSLLQAVRPAPIGGPPTIFRLNPVEHPLVDSNNGKIQTISTGNFNNWRYSNVPLNRAGPWATIVAQARANPSQAVELINNYVNGQVRFRSDSQQFPHGLVTDIWNRAEETLTNNKDLGFKAGDCEDYSIAKMKLLQLAGFSPNDLFLTVGWDTSVGQVHAMLVVRTNGRFLVLNNLSNDIKDSDRFCDFTPTFAISANNRLWCFKGTCLIEQRTKI